jgi:hypothetical protein
VNHRSGQPFAFWTGGDECTNGNERADGAKGYCEAMAPIVFRTTAFDWLDDNVRA